MSPRRQSPADSGSRGIQCGGLPGCLKALDEQVTFKHSIPKGQSCARTSTTPNRLPLGAATASDWSPSFLAGPPPFLQPYYSPINFLNSVITILQTLLPSALGINPKSLTGPTRAGRWLSLQPRSLEAPHPSGTRCTGFSLAHMDYYYSYLRTFATAVLTTCELFLSLLPSLPHYLPLSSGLGLSLSWGSSP